MSATVPRAGCPGSWQALDSDTSSTESHTVLSILFAAGAYHWTQLLVQHFVLQLEKTYSWFTSVSATSAHSNIFNQSWWLFQQLKPIVHSFDVIVEDCSTDNVSASVPQCRGMNFWATTVPFELPGRLRLTSLAECDLRRSGLSPGALLKVQVSGPALPKVKTPRLTIWESSTTEYQNPWFRFETPRTPNVNAGTQRKINEVFPDWTNQQIMKRPCLDHWSPFTPSFSQQLLDVRNWQPTCGAKNARQPSTGNLKLPKNQQRVAHTHTHTLIKKRAQRAIFSRQRYMGGNSNSHMEQHHVLHWSSTARQRLTSSWRGKTHPQQFNLASLPWYWKYFLVNREWYNIPHAAYDFPCIEYDDSR